METRPVRRCRRCHPLSSFSAHPSPAVDVRGEEEEEEKGVKGGSAAARNESSGDEWRVQTRQLEFFHCSLTRCGRGGDDDVVEAQRAPQYVWWHGV